MHGGTIIASHQPVVPVRLATIYPDEATVTSMLTAGRAEFTAALLNVAVSRVRPASAGWDVTVYAAPLTSCGPASVAERAGPMTVTKVRSGKNSINKRLQAITAAPQRSRVATPHIHGLTGKKITT